MSTLERYAPELPTNGATPTPAPAPTAPARTLSLKLAKKAGIATFRLPTVSDFQQAESVKGAIVGNDPRPEMFRKLGELCLQQWGNSDQMPDDEAMTAKDDQNLIKLFREYIEQELVAKQSKNYEVDEDENHAVTLTNGDRLIFKEPTRMDMRQAEKALSGVESNIKLATALCISWNGQKPGFADAFAQFKALNLDDYYKVTGALEGFL